MWRDTKDQIDEKKDAAARACDGSFRKRKYRQLDKLSRSYIPALLNQVLPTTDCEARATTAAVASENLIIKIAGEC